DRVVVALSAQKGEIEAHPLQQGLPAPQLCGEAAHAPGSADRLSQGQLLEIRDAELAPLEAERQSDLGTVEPRGRIRKIAGSALRLSAGARLLRGRGGVARRICFGGRLPQRDLEARQLAEVDVLSATGAARGEHHERARTKQPDGSA